MNSLGKQILQFNQNYLSNISFKKYYSSLNNSEKQKIMVSLYTIFTLFTLSFCGLFAINPTISTISTLSAQYRDDKIILEALEAKQKALVSLDTKYQEIEQDLLLVDELALPSSTQMPQLTRQLEKLAKEHNLVLNRLEYGKVDLFPLQNGSLEFNISTEGTKKDTNDFIADIGNFDRVTILNTITLSRESDNTRLTITGKAYFTSD